MSGGIFHSFLEINLHQTSTWSYITQMRKNDTFCAGLFMWEHNHTTSYSTEIYCEAPQSGKQIYAHNSIYFITGIKKTKVHIHHILFTVLMVRKKEKSNFVIMLADLFITFTYSWLLAFLYWIYNNLFNLCAAKLPVIIFFLPIGHQTIIKDSK